MVEAVYLRGKCLISTNANARELATDLSPLVRAHFACFQPHDIHIIFKPVRGNEDTAILHHLACKN